MGKTPQYFYTIPPFHSYIQLHKNLLATCTSTYQSTITTLAQLYLITQLLHPCSWLTQLSPLHMQLFTYKTTHISHTLAAIIKLQLFTHSPLINLHTQHLILFHAQPSAYEKILLSTEQTSTRHSWQNGTRCRDGLKVLWCHSHIAWLAFHSYISGGSRGGSMGSFENTICANVLHSYTTRSHWSYALQHHSRDS